MTPYKFINKIILKLFSYQFSRCLNVKKLRLKYFDLIGEKDNALKECDYILSLYKKSGIRKDITYINTKYRKAELLYEMNKETLAKNELMALLPTHTRKSREKLDAIYEKATLSKGKAPIEEDEYTIKDEFTTGIKKPIEKSCPKDIDLDKPRCSNTIIPKVNLTNSHLEMNI